MDIPAMSMALANVDTLSNVGIKMLSKTLDMAEKNGAQMIKMMERSVNPSVGGNFDVSV